MDERDAAAILATVEQDRARAAAALEPDPRLLYGAWGAAWLVGFGVLYAMRAGIAGVQPPPPVAGVVFAGLVVGAMVVTGVHLGRRFAGVRGASSAVGAMYGWSWMIAFLVFVAIMTAVTRDGVDEAVIGLLWSTGSGLVVGILYMVGGALWQDRLQYGLGAWILVCSGAGALAGSPGVYVVMSLAGGGGFLAAAAWFAVRGRRGRCA